MTGQFLTPITEDTFFHNVHPQAACDGRPCTVHNPSGHHMRLWPMWWSDTRKMLWRKCPHDTFHPDPDDVLHLARSRPEWNFWAMVDHHCSCGCCLRPSELGGNMGEIAEMGDAARAAAQKMLDEARADRAEVGLQDWEKDLLAESAAKAFQEALDEKELREEVAEGEKLLAEINSAEENLIVRLMRQSQNDALAVANQLIATLTRQVKELEAERDIVAERVTDLATQDTVMNPYLYLDALQVSRQDIAERLEEEES